MSRIESNEVLREANGRIKQRLSEAGIDGVIYEFYELERLGGAALRTTKIIPWSLSPEKRVKASQIIDEETVTVLRQLQTKILHDT